MNRQPGSSSGITRMTRVRSALLKFGEEVAEDRVALDEVDGADEMTGAIEAEGVVVCDDGAVNQVGREPAWIDDPGDGGHVPENL